MHYNRYKDYNNNILNPMKATFFMHPPKSPKKSHSQGPSTPKKTKKRAQSALNRSKQGPATKTAPPPAPPRQSSLSAATLSPIKQKKHKGRKPVHKIYKPKEVRKLTKEYYKILKDEGFKDLETMSYKDGTPIDLIHGQSLSTIAKKYKPETLHYYRLWSNYISHSPVSLILEGSRNIKACELYAEGKSYRAIIKVLNALYPSSTLSLFSLHHILKRIEQDVLKWNKTSPEGLDFDADIEPLEKAYHPGIVKKKSLTKA